MELDTLSHHGIDAWLQDPKGNRFPLGPPIVDGNKITTVIELDNPKSYSLEWCTSPGAPAINAWCELFRPAGKAGHIKMVRIANHYMAENDLRTQSRSSKGRLELPLQRDAWLWTPRSKIGVISLEIRRLRSPPRETERQDEKNPGSLIYEIDVDMLDDDNSNSGGETKPPYVIFRFQFKPEEMSDERTDSSSSSQISRRGTRHSSLRSKKTTREKSSDLSELSESEPEEPPVASGLPLNHTGIQVDRRAKAPPKNNERPPSASEVASVSTSPERDIDLLLRKRKTIIQQQEELEEEKRLKRAKHDKLVQDLWADTQARAERLAEVQHESQQIDDEIQKIQAALYM